MIERIESIKIKPTPIELADEFWSMDGEEQAIVFNRLGLISGTKFDFQSDYIVEHLLPEGRNVVRALAERI